MKISTSRTSVAAAACAALALTLAGCGSGGEKDDGAASAAEPELGPLDEYFEQMYGDYDEEQGNADMIRVEELTAECMADLGFQYTPVDYSSKSSGMALSADAEDIPWDTLEFAEQYGYGATTNPGGEEQPLPEEEGQEFVDPNQEYVETMSETEQQAYWEALYGVQNFDETDPEAEYEYNWEDAGCQGSASNEVYGDMGMGGGDDEFAALQEDMNAMWEAAMVDPRITELNAEWATCMADAGYAGLAEPADAQNLIYDKTNAIYEDAYADMDPNGEWTEEDYAAIEAGIQDDLAAITDEEIETAVADYTCRDEVDLTKAQQDINIEYQQDFVDQHKDELDAWLASTQADSGAKG
ncbi:hypothetical protein [Cellulomonas sp. KRMCY2]|uniref:hypothetical protein n=1 Tax=Cellulomonas sp. KRMCY2 TaxID=1304865 RepID=UPI00045E8D01|nr:hypothetical protein [Cellulomonas sp. KRMCY2]